MFLSSLQSAEAPAGFIYNLKITLQCLYNIIIQFFVFVFASTEIPAVFARWFCEYRGVSQSSGWPTKIWARELRQAEQSPLTFEQNRGGRVITGGAEEQREMGNSLLLDATKVWKMSCVFCIMYSSYLMWLESTSSLCCMRNSEWLWFKIFYFHPSPFTKFSKVLSSLSVWQFLPKPCMPCSLELSWA